jgi:hypothetical protein
VRQPARYVTQRQPLRQFSRIQSKLGDAKSRLISDGGLGCSAAIETTTSRHPDPVDVVERLHALRQRLGHDHRHVGLGCPLIFPQLAEPPIDSPAAGEAEILGSFCSDYNLY